MATTSKDPDEVQPQGEVPVNSKNAVQKPLRRSARITACEPGKVADAEEIPDSPKQRNTGKRSRHDSADEGSGVYEIERLLEKQWSGRVLWLKIKWKTLATGSWEKADHMREELGEEDYQALLDTLPRKRRKKGSKW
jgi:hypothetical protein